MHRGDAVWGDLVAKIIHTETIYGPLLLYGADIHDLTITNGSDDLELTVFAGELRSARNVEFDVSGNASFQTQHFIGPGSDGFLSADFGSLTLNLSASRVGNILTTALGEASTATILTSQNNGQASDTVSVVGVTTTTSTFMVSTRPNESGLATFERQTDGSLSLVTPAPDPTIGQISDIVTVTAYGETWIIGTSLTNDSVESLTLNDAGALTYRDGFGAADGLGVNAPVSLKTFTLDGQPYVVFGSSDTASLSVLRLEANGSFTAIDHVLDDLTTRFDNTTLIETYQMGENVFIIATGSDDGFSLFQVRPDGKLTLLETVVDSSNITLDNVSAMAMAQDGSDLRIFIASNTEAGLSNFSFDLSNLGNNFVGSSGSDTIVGSAKDDIILGEDGDDILSGGNGNDIIVDGGGRDILIGGLGADVFTFDPDGVDDTIQDFQRGIDALDLSFFPLLYDAQALGYVATFFGAQLTFKRETIYVYSDDGNTLSLADLTSADPFNVNRPALVLSSEGGSYGGGQTQIGTDANNVLIGTVGDDILTGNLGDDILHGGAGADALYGGLGLDTADYTTATSGMILDLANPALNTGDAAGDSYASIEVIVGTGFDDQIFGSAGVNIIRGRNGADQLSGRDGNDWLDGGFGDDILNGGAGADTLIGGDQSDTASYVDSIKGIQVDLSYVFRNTGQAAGDTYLSIEDLEGTSFSDKIYGDGNANTLTGGKGADWLLGRAGDDRLLGGNGDDVLDGSAGADYLDGGIGIDRAQYFLSKQGLTINLSNSVANTGEAFGDVYVSIENVGGSQFDDTIIGNEVANMLIGNDGDDTLFGLGGSDTLRGGQGNDRLTGGAGNDLLDGGTGSDVFAFDSGFGTDLIRDFSDAEDLLEINLSLLGSTPPNSDAVLDNFGTLDGSDAILDFGGGDIFVVEDINDLSLLASSMVFV